MSHTPGPWTATTSFEHGRFCVVAEGKYLPHTEANASLIAAAPDMLEALEGALPTMKRFGLHTQVQDAIAKAKG